LAAAVPIALMPANLLHAGSRARSLKEAQSNLSVPLFVVSRIPIVQMFLQKKGFAGSPGSRSPAKPRSFRAHCAPKRCRSSSCSSPARSRACRHRAAAFARATKIVK